MKAAIVKPDYGIRGGFEFVVDMLASRLPDELGMPVDIVKVDMTRLDDNALPVSDSEYDQLGEFPSFLTYLKKVLAFRTPELHDRLSYYDIVFSTQPPSFAIQHPRHFSLFYHHERSFYDLLDYSILFQVLPQQQKALAPYVREIDTHLLQQANVIAASQNVASRLTSFNGIHPCGTFYAGIDDAYYNYSGEICYSPLPICVGRHEFPKRPELFLQAMKSLPEFKGVVIGTGGRTDDLVRADQCYTYLKSRHLYIDGEIHSEINRMINLGDISSGIESLLKKSTGVPTNVVFTGSVSPESLLGHYARSLCVVCTAYDEDYGLTALEGMSMRKPVIACNDGGGYVELIEDGVTGFLVDPDPEAIAFAIRRLVEDVGLAKRLGNEGFAQSREYSWDNATSQISNIVREFL